MDWERYKQICDSPNVFSRWMLEQTSELVDAQLSAVFELALRSAPVPKPEGHRGGDGTDMFELSLSMGQVADIAQSICEAAAADQTTSATRDRGLGGFSEAWNEYALFLEKIPLGTAR